MHRPPYRDDEAERLPALDALMRIVVFSPEMKRRLLSRFPLRHVHVAPHPPILFPHRTRPFPRRAGRESDVTPDGRRIIGIGLLGEVRPEKNFERAIELLVESPADLRQRLRVVMAGSATHQQQAGIKTRLDRAGVRHRLYLSHDPRLGYRAVADAVVARSIRESDIVIFPYTGNIAGAYSGNFSDALVAGARLLVSAESVMADTVEEHGVGRRFHLDSGESFGVALRALADAIDNETGDDPGRLALMAAHSGELFREQMLQAAS
jgi:hypothetical protein